MKKITEKNKKQLMGGMVYIALAVTVVAVTVGTVVTSFKENSGEVTQKADEGGNGTIYNGDYNLKLPNDNSINPGDFNLDTPVSDNPSGIDANVTEPDVSSETNIMQDNVTVSEETLTQDTPQETVSVPDTPQAQPNAVEEIVSEYGFDGFIRPCSGYISKEFSMDVPVYSVSMYDYRTHEGIDIVNEVGTQVKAVSNGVISEIYDDYLYGKTVIIEHDDGICSVYSNLSADLPADLSVGKRVITGEIIGGIGETAMCEAADSEHLHFEMKSDGEYVNPEEYFVN